MAKVIFLLILGLIFLIKGGDWFVDGASGIARRFRLPEILIGATVVSIGTTPFLRSWCRLELQCKEVVQSLMVTL